jgi:pyranose oxidase
MPYSDMTTDVLIIGSGPIGATFARLLVEAGRKVIMIDTGKQLSERTGEHLRNSFRYQQEPNMFTDTIMSQLEEYSVPSGIFYRPNSAVRNNFENRKQKWWRNMPAASAVYAVGGMGTLWTASTPDPAPFERASFISDDDWTWMLDLAKRLLKVNKNVFDFSLLGHAVKDRYLEKGFSSVGPLQQAAERFRIDDAREYFIHWTGVDTILGPLLDDPKYQSSFQILAEHRAEKLNKSVDQLLITSASVTDLHSWTSFNIFADTFIVAAGSFLTPTLLWASDICPPALGHYLNDNLEASCHVVVDSEIISAMRHIPGNPHATDPIPITHHDPGPAFGTTPTPERPWHGQIHRLGREFIYLPSEDVRYQVHFTWYGTVDSQYRNCIRWDGEKDRFGMPQITIDFFYSRQDILRAARMWWDMVKTARAIGKIHGIPMISPPGSTLHLQGTYRMGTDKEESVTDSFSKVWDMDNLYLGGLGIIPNSMASNPTLTAVAYAVRAAARLTGQTLLELLQGFEKTSGETEIEDFSTKME